jgi:hypothetical protein
MADYVSLPASASFGRATPPAFAAPSTAMIAHNMRGSACTSTPNYRASCCPKGGVGSETYESNRDNESGGNDPRGKAYTERRYAQAKNKKGYREKQRHPEAQGKVPQTHLFVSCDSGAVKDWLCHSATMCAMRNLSRNLWRFKLYKELSIGRSGRI